MGSEVIKSIQKIIYDTIKASKPCDIRYATIVSINPLSIELQNVQLIIKAPNVSSLESTNELTIDDIIHKHSYYDSDTGEGASGSRTRETENALDNIQTYINNVGQGKKDDKIIIRKGLQEGDKVAVIRANGGQDYLIIGRVNV